MTNSTTNLLNQPSEQFLQTDLVKILDKIAGEIEIKSDFSISQPQLGDFFLKDKIDVQFQQLSPAVQQQYLCVRLQTLLHELYYRQSQVETLQPEKLENQPIKWTKSKFYQQLHAHNFGQGYFDPGWLVIDEEQNELLPVRKNDLTLHISPVRHLQPQDRQAKVGDLVAVKMPANLVEPEFYIAVGDGGAINEQNSDRFIVNIYFHLTAQGAVPMMSSITKKLNQLKIPFNFKVLYDSDDYPREDAAILSIERQQYEIVRSILKDIYSANCAYFQPEIPLFTKLLAPGLSLAEEPTAKTSAMENFGLHRFKPIAKGLITAWQQGDNLPQQKIELILEYFSEQQIDLKYPYLNANSEDVYMF
ncbi:hypothetical protein Sta7437_3248 [Stanieria cyanosphaera PCC 7437]|uniref:Uncharacterized protein n=1 Tax=Stanieria cyanosphaera (strain ATCC 29371 / PCC 7437) TaxID=111780 RepID=K9XVY9_STAC7|nr:T3SS effector HopA1 family protein [Stanieria cyanosphaera]AFZ36755.1 hypothetical protein Sta7437_3248 [Stanieria cyanosphaera PCC 7437]